MSFSMRGILSTTIAAISLILMVATGRTDVTISLGTVNVAGGSTSVSVPIYVTGGDAITDMTAYFQIGDGGILFGGTAGPKITSINFAGSIWGSAPGGFSWSATFTDPDGDPATVNGTPTQLEELFVSLDVPGQTVNATGLLCTLVIDTTGFATGSFAFAMKDVYPPDNTTSTEFSNGGTVVGTDITNGTLAIGTGGDPIVPELLIERLGGGTMRLKFASEATFGYTIQWDPGLDEEDWASIAPSLAGTGSELVWTDDGSQTGLAPSGATRRFYRLLIE